MWQSHEDQVVLVVLHMRERFSAIRRGVHVAAEVLQQAHRERLVLEVVFDQQNARREGFERAVRLGLHARRLGRGDALRVRW